MDETKDNAPLESVPKRTLRFKVPSKMTDAPATHAKPTEAGASAPAASEVGKDPLYSRLLNGLYDAILITDLEGFLEDANNRAMDVLRYHRSELVRGHIADLLVGLSDAMLASIRDNLSEGRFTVLEAYCIRGDGSRFATEVAVSRLNLTPSGSLCFALRNISQRKSAQDMLKQEHYTLHSAACGIALIDMEGRILYVNPAFRQLWDQEKDAAINGRKLEEFFDPEFAGTFRACLEKGERRVSEMQRARSNGKRLVMQVTSAPAWDKDECLMGLVLSFVDITSLKQAEERIRREADEQLSHVRNAADFSGQLNILSIPDVVQFIESSQKTGRLEIVNDQGAVRAQMLFANGAMVRARSGEVAGFDAVYEALRGGGQSFRFIQMAEPPQADGSLAGATINILLDALRRLDEAGGSAS